MIEQPREVPRVVELGNPAPIRRPGALPQALASERGQLARSQAAIVKRLRVLLTLRTLGGEARLLGRVREISALLARLDPIRKRIAEIDRLAEINSPRFRRMAA